MDDHTIALIIIGDMTLTERKLKMELAAAENEIKKLQEIIDQNNTESKNVSKLKKKRK